MTAEQLFREHHLRIFRFLRRATRSTELAEDLTQEVSVRVVRALPRYRAQERESAWIWTVVRNVLAHERRRRVSRPVADDLDENGGPAPLVPPDRRLVLEQALALLPELDRLVFLLREVGGLGHNQIAGVCGLTADAVRNRIYYRAREALRTSVLIGAGGRGPRLQKGVDR